MATEIVTTSFLFHTPHDRSIGNPDPFAASVSDGNAAPQYDSSSTYSSSSMGLSNGNMLSHGRKSSEPAPRPPPPPPPPRSTDDNNGYSNPHTTIPPPPPPRLPPKAPVLPMPPRSRSVSSSSSTPSERHSCPPTYTSSERRTASPAYTIPSRPTSEPWGDEREQLLVEMPALQHPAFTPPGPRSVSTASLTESEDMYGTNKLHFPPLLPTVGSRSALFRDRKNLTHAITSTVGQTERRTTRITHANHIPSSASRRGTSTVSDASESSFSSEDDVIQEYWAQIKDNRISIGVTKDNMARERVKMRELRRKKDKADTAFMNYAGLLLAPRDTTSKILPPLRDATSKMPLDHRFAEMQRLHTEYQYMESRYEELEIDLDKREAELNVLEVLFFSTIAKRYLRQRTAGSGLNARDTLENPTYERDVPFELLGISKNGPADDDHPFWTALVDAIGDMNLAHEDLEELRMRREQIKYDTELQKNISRRAREENEEFMEEFPEEEALKVARLEETRELVQHHREKCQRHGVAKKHPSPAVAYALDPDMGEELALDDTVPARKTLAHYRFPTLLSCPDHVLRHPEPLSALGDLKHVLQLPAADPSKKVQLEAAKKEYGIHQLVFDTKVDDDSSFVQRWLLHQVRTCPLEAHQLASVFQETTSLTIKDHERWQHDVLHHWWRDGSPGSAPDPMRDFLVDFPPESDKSLSLAYGSGAMLKSRASSAIIPASPTWGTRDSSKKFKSQSQTVWSRATQSTSGQ